MVFDYDDVKIGTNLDLSRHRVLDIFFNLLRLRQAEDREKLVLIADSLSDLGIFLIMAEEALKAKIKVGLVYYITNIHDSLEITGKYLDKFKSLNVPIAQFNSLQPDQKILGKAVDYFIQMGASVAIANLSDDYDIRQAINDYAGPKLIPILEIPTLDRTSIASDIFSENFSAMKVLGNQIRDIFRTFADFRIVSLDGTDLRISVNPNWLDESDNDFTHRAWDYVDGASFLPPPQDNPPGEVYTNVRTADGILVVYQFDEDVVKYMFRNIALLPFQIQETDYLKYIYDPNDPVILKIENGFINLDSIDTSKGIRSKILKYYLETKQIEDLKYVTEFVKHPLAASKTAELAIGTNSKAANPEEEIIPGLHIISTLITEKKRGIWHMAFGNTPCPDAPEYFNHSSTHIDCGLRNPDLQVYGLRDGHQILLTSTSPGQPGEIGSLLEF